MPLVRRVPKRGFHNLFRQQFSVINVGRLDHLEGDEFTPESLLSRGAIAGLRDGLKVLGDGDLKRAIKVSAHRVSESARQKIEAAGGKIELIEITPGALRRAREQARAASRPPVETAAAEAEMQPPEKAKPARPAGAKGKKAPAGHAAKPVAKKPAAKKKPAAAKAPAKKKTAAKASKAKSGGAKKK
jgi:hypothetical protein